MKPDVMRHCDRNGYMVLFGTGRYLGISDRANTDVQTIYGIWDYGDDADNSEYHGTFDITTGALSNQAANVTLLEQTEIDWRTLFGHDLRTISHNAANWDTIVDPDSGQYPDPGSDACTDGLDNDVDLSVDEADECIVHTGWYFNLPMSGERVIKDVMIRGGAAIVISSIPTTSSCSGGGDTIVHEIDACTGARLDKPQFDINNDGVIDDQDRINIGTTQDPVWVGLSGKSYTGILHPPVVLRSPGGKTEMKIFSSSAGVTEKLIEEEEKKGIRYWRDER
jgi:type IV pilus assembly protein PilY1